MKLIRFGQVGKEKPGIILNDEWYDVSAHVQDYNEEFFEADGLSKLAGIAANYTLPGVSKDTRLGAPVSRPSKIICIGLNYSDHAAESNMQLPAEPVIFFKATTAIVGPNDELVIPKNSVKTDWEVELAVVIGKKA
ncbi:MAG TPA: fumarylacetoacetate hydrolase family protein, partial [Chitinophagaceae bacterium]